MAFGKEIKRIREASNMTAQQMIDLIGLDLAKYRNWEARDGNPKYEDSQIVEKFFGMPLDQITTLERMPAHLLIKKEDKKNIGDIPPSQPISIDTQIIDGKLTIDDFRNIYQQGLIVAEAHRNFSLAAIKTAEADIERAKAETIKAEATRTFADTGKKQTDNNSELVGLLKKFFTPVSSETLKGNVTVRLPIGDDHERMVMNGLGELWSTVEEGRIIVGKLLSSNAVVGE